VVKRVYLDNRVFVSGADLSGWSNALAVEESIDDKAVTNFRSGGAREVMGGLSTVEISGNGQWEAGSPGMPDDTFWGNRRVAEPWSFAPSGASDLAPGNLMYLTKAVRLSMKLGEAVGEVAPWEATARGSSPLVRGQSAHPSGVPRTATGTGTVLDMLAGPAGTQKVYANLHVLSVAVGGATLTVRVESSTTIGFAAPTTRGTFTAAAAVGGQHMRIDTPGTDRYWRVAWTIAGTTPSFLFLASLGIE
jgi:hypothetical protein